MRHLWEGYRRKTAHGWRARESEWALRDINFAVAGGEILGVVGGNGSGKTTLLQCLAGVLRPTRGNLTIQGRVGSLVDATGFHPDLTGRENIRVLATLMDLGSRRTVDVLRGAEDLSELGEDVLVAPIRTYSAGMGLRLGLGLVLAAEPDVLLVDEVLAVGDEHFQTAAWLSIRKLAASGSSVVVVSHRLDDIARNCCRVLVLRDGEVSVLGAPEEALDRYRADMGDLVHQPAPPTRWEFSFHQHRSHRSARRR